MSNLQPFEILLRRECRFKARPIKPGNKKKSPGCALCNASKVDPVHLGEPPSMNNRMLEGKAFGTVKGAWQRKTCLELIRLEIPRGTFKSVIVEVQIGFNEYRDRDEGNFRWMVEKMLGDALVNGYGYMRDVRDDEGKVVKQGGKTVREWFQEIEGGWLEADTFFPTRRYSVGNLDGQHTPGESWTRILVFPSDIEPETKPRVTR